MGYEAAPWLERAEREKEERCSELLTALELKPGQVVADVGCGSGFYTFKLARLVGPKGKVYAVDVQPEMVDLVKKEAARIDAAGVESAKNVEPLLGTIVDPKLPDASVDLAFLVDVYHELGRPAEMLAALAKALKKDGRVVLVEFRLEDPDVPIKLLHKMSKEQMRKELAASGFEVASEYDKLPWQHVVFFRVAAKAPDSRDAPRPAPPADRPKPKPKDGESAPALSRSGARGTLVRSG
jgi:ubiquinone/menaquinone biosynthesis C-methylase UbiE